MAKPITEYTTFGMFTSAGSFINLALGYAGAGLYSSTATYLGFGASGAAALGAAASLGTWGSLAAMSFAGGFAAAIPAFIIRHLFKKVGMHSLAFDAILGVASGFAGLYLAAGFLGVATQPLLITAAIGLAVLPIIAAIVTLCALSMVVPFMCCCICCSQAKDTNQQHLNNPPRHDTGMFAQTGTSPLDDRFPLLKHTEFVS